MIKLLLSCFLFLDLYNLYAQKMNAAIIHAMEIAIQNKTYPNIHSVLISYKGHFIYENYWAGKDFKHGKYVGEVPHGKDSLHSIQSISKSVVSACIGIALKQKKIKNINQRIFEFLPGYTALDTGLKKTITIKDLLTMTAGFQWDEHDYSKIGNSAHVMDSSANPLAYVLRSPMADAPGKSFTYNSGATEILAAILENATGKTLTEFAGEYLFRPLGIKDFEWRNCANSKVINAFGGLYMKPKDMLKFGLLYLHDGKFGTKQIIPAGWVQQSITSQIKTNDPYGDDYGFQWWLIIDTIIKRPIFIPACSGTGGQYIFVDKANSLVVVITAGNYRGQDYSYDVFKDFIYPAVFKKK
jgi:Beta-lactamase class C and other penicillin binding proteins